MQTSPIRPAQSAGSRWPRRLLLVAVVLGALGGIGFANRCFFLTCDGSALDRSGAGASFPQRPGSGFVFMLDTVENRSEDPLVIQEIVPNMKGAWRRVGTIEKVELAHAGWGGSISSPTYPATDVFGGRCRVARISPVTGYELAPRRTDPRERVFVSILFRVNPTPLPRGAHTSLKMDGYTVTYEQGGRRFSQDVGSTMEAEISNDALVDRYSLKEAQRCRGQAEVLPQL